MANLYQLTASQARDSILAGKFTIEDYAKSLLARIKEREHIKAWAYINPDEVISQAKKLDALPVEKRGLLHGVVIGVKDVVLTKDMPTCYNSPIYKDQGPFLVDAAPIITLRSAGILILGKTTTTEFAGSYSGSRSGTRNPHNPDHTPGGSSSGSGAAVGDYQVPIALGTQTMGSTIRPGSFNGTYAFKPTWGAISREGLAQYSITTDTLGFFTRSIEDLQLLSNYFQLADDIPLPIDLFSLEGAKIAFCQTPAWSLAGFGTQAAWNRAQILLKAAGANVSDLTLPAEFANVRKWHFDVLAGEGRASFLGNYTLAKDKLDPALVAQVETNLSRRDLLDAYDGCARLRPEWDEIASKYDAVIVPSAVDEAPKGLENTGDPTMCSMWTILGAPALNIPGFVGGTGLPTGLSVVGARYTDLHLLYVAKTIGVLWESEGGFRHDLF